MSFLTPALLAGAALIALPIALHLIMRRQPQKLLFPALRFVQKRQSRNQTRLRLRQLLLLLLRCAVIAMLALALARPVLRGSGMRGAADPDAIAAALVFDNSLRMEYRLESQTRLERAKEMADWLLEQLPLDSQVVVADRTSRYRRRAGDRDAARLRVDRLVTSADVRPLHETLAEAIEGLADTGGRREAYVFTDMTAAVWTEESLAEIGVLLEQNEDVSLYLVDVGVESPSNRGFADLQLSSARLIEGDALTISAPVVVAPDDDAQELSAELWIASGGPAEKRAEAIVSSVAGGGPREAQFTTTLPVGLHQGFVRLRGSDPLSVDDQRYFTVTVSPPRPLLIVAQSPPDATFLLNAIAPSGSSAAGQYDCRVTSFSKLRPDELVDIEAVFLLDPPALTAPTWQALVDYVTDGGAVGVFLGRGALGDRQAFSAPAPQALLPGELLRTSRDESYFRPVSYSHPALAPMAEYAEAIPWSAFPVYRYWQLGELNEGAAVVATLANGDPAIVERTIGAGRVLVMTTPISDPSSGVDPWNTLPTGAEPWPFLALATSLADYLSGIAEARLNYAPGATAVVPIPPGVNLTGFVLETPGGDGMSMPSPSDPREIIVGTTDEVGNYRVVAGGASGRLDEGFSVNCSGDIGRLDRVAFEQIETTLGEDRVRLASSQRELSGRIDLGRVGREFYPWLICLVAIAFAAEQLVSNWFYSRRGQPG